MYSLQLSQRKTEVVDIELEEDEFDYFAPEFNDEVEEDDDENNEREYCD